MHQTIPKLPSNGRVSMITARPVALFLSVVFALGGLFAQAAPSASAQGGRWFWIDHGTGPIRVQCRLATRKSGVSVYVARDAFLSSPQARALQTTFLRRILPVETRLFGKPRNLLPLNILITPLDGNTMGYFDENDAARPRRMYDPAHSNRANVLYVRPPNQMPDANGVTEAEEVSAHELQHLIEYRLRVVDHRVAPQSNWLNEGFSFYAQLASGFWTPRDSFKVHGAADDPSWQVTSITSVPGRQGRQARVAYGRVGLFATYLAVRYGSRFVRDVLRRRETGLTAIDRVLRGLSRAGRIGDAFSDWGVAGYMHGPGRYGYGRFGRLLRCAPHLAAAPAMSYPFDSSRTLQGLALRPWGQSYFQFVATRSGTLRLTFSGDGDAFKLAAVVQDSTGRSARQVLHPSVQGDRQTFRLQGFGTVYDRLTLVVSDVNGLADNSPAGALDRYRIEASVNVRNNNRVARATASTRLNPDFPFRNGLHL